MDNCPQGRITNETNKTTNPTRCYGGDVTTIVFDGKTLATDSQVTNRNTVVGIVNKIIKIDYGYCAISGDSDLQIDFINWINGGEKPYFDTDKDNIWAIVIRYGEIEYYSTNLRKQIVSAPVCIGSGSIIARAALKCGKDAIGAVEIACELDIYSSLPVNSVVIK